MKELAVFLKSENISERYVTDQDLTRYTWHQNDNTLQYTKLTSQQRSLEPFPTGRVLPCHWELIGGPHTLEQMRMFALQRLQTQDPTFLLINGKNIPLVLQTIPKILSMVIEK